MKRTALARFIVFAVLQVILCVMAFSLAAGITSAEPEVQPAGSLYIDGTDFTPIAELSTAALNGVLSLLSVGASLVMMTAASAALLIPFRFIAVRKGSSLTRAESRGTMIVILFCTAVSLISAAVYGGAWCMLLTLLMALPQLLLGILLYWLCIFLRSGKQQ